MRTMRLGDVVTEKEHNGRGVVVRANGLGYASPVLGSWLYRSDCVVMQGPGLFTVTNDPGRWDEVPSQCTSALERVRSATVRYEEPSWVPEGEEPQDHDSFPYALVLALLPPSVQQDLDTGDLLSFVELVEAVAERFDKLQGVRDMAETGHFEKARQAGRATAAGRS